MTDAIRTFALIALITVGAPAAAGEDRAAQAGNQLEETIAQLNLSDEQIDQVTPLLEESMAAQKKIMASYGVDLEQRNNSAGKLKRRDAMSMRKELQAVREDTRRELEQVLTAEQLDEFGRIQEEREAEMRARIRAAR